MADAIQWSLPLGNGAVNLHYNEVVYSWFNSYIKVNEYNYEIMLILNPICITSFVFTSTVYNQFSSNDTVIYLINHSNNQYQVATLNWARNRYGTQLVNNSIGFLLR